MDSCRGGCSVALMKIVSCGQTGVDRVCHKEVATEEVREASQSHASDSPSPDERRDA